MIRRERGIPEASEGLPGSPALSHTIPWHAGTLRLADGVTIHTFTSGRTEAGAPALVLVHGMGHWTQAAWDRLVPEFAATHRIVAFDLPGFGASDKPDRPYTLAYFTTALRAVIARFELHHFGLVGHSLGGLIAANYAAYHPDRVRALGLLGPAGFLRTPHLAARIAGSRLALRLPLRLRPARGFVRASLRKATYDPDTMTEPERAHALALGGDPAIARTFLRVYASSARDLFHTATLHARLAAYSGPTTLVWGRQDRYIPARALRTARKVYPHADALLIDRCGHCPGIEYPRLVAARLLANGM